jgi:hypothetical protein
VFKQVVQNMPDMLTAEYVQRVQTAGDRCSAFDVGMEAKLNLTYVRLAGVLQYMERYQRSIVREVVKVRYSVGTLSATENSLQAQSCRAV